MAMHEALPQLVVLLMLVTIATCRQGCNIDVADDNIIGRPLNVILQNLAVSMERLEVQTNRVIDDSVDMLSDIYPRAPRYWRRLCRLTGRNSTRGDNSGSDTITETLTNHYRALGTLINNVEHISTDVYIGSRGRLREDFRELCRDADVTLCTMKIGLIGLSSDTSQILHDDVSDMFRHNSDKTLRNFGLICTAKATFQHMADVYRTYLENGL